MIDDHIIVLELTSREAAVIRRLSVICAWDRGAFAPELKSIYKALSEHVITGQLENIRPFAMDRYSGDEVEINSLVIHEPSDKIMKNRGTK